MEKTAKIYVAGHTGLAGSAIMRELKKQGFGNLLLKTHAELDLLDQAAVRDFFQKEKPEYVFLAAAKVGGIGAIIDAPADFIYQNLQIELNVISSAFASGVKKLLFLASSCNYPKFCPQPMKEEYFLSSKPEPTNKPYSIAKIAGITYCQALNKQYGANFISLLPTNLYGDRDNFNLATSHVIPGIIAKFHQAKIDNLPEVELWGTGSPLREFMHSDDLGRACVFLMENYNDPEVINVGTGQEISIKELTEMISRIVGYNGNIKWNTSKPDGVARKVVDISKISALGWKYQTELEPGLRSAYDWYLNNIANGR